MVVVVSYGEQVDADLLVTPELIRRYEAISGLPIQRWRDEAVCETCGGDRVITKTVSPRFTLPRGLTCEVPCPNCQRPTDD